MDLGFGVFRFGIGNEQTNWGVKQGVLLVRLIFFGTRTFYGNRGEVQHTLEPKP